ncbi:MAG: taurine dioxygenase [Halieaceae bacterium MED-G27]|nr:MAG: taurine dioxygenase [Halieaceae bacterium MED-G27]|tara:strand:+ start:12283 stop:13119 length:837 start_codon:yes stop_codon:yes gene_type:complete
MSDSVPITPLTPAIGAKIGNVDLRSVSDYQIEAIRAALLEYQVIFFRDQELDQEQHIAFARHFGDLEIHPATPPGQANPEVLHIAHGPNSKGRENAWHSDVTWRDKPSLGSILKAVEVPAVGGDTLFANMVLAYDQLSDEIKEKITGRVAVHDIARVFAGRLNMSEDELREKYPLSEHPVVRTHPETGRSVLYVNVAFTTHIKDMDSAESDALLADLFRTAWNPELQCRFKWRPGSLAFWDNRACQHFAASDYFPQVRKMERVTIAGDKPYFDGSEAA